MLQRTFLTGLAITLLVAQACGGGDGKKRVQNAGDGGAAGEAGADFGMDAAGAAGTPVNDGGTGGVPDVGGTGGVPATGGVGGSDEPPIPMAGAGGEAPLPPKPELLFTVKYGANGLADTALSKQANPENSIYTTDTASQDETDGTNAVKVTGASLGLAETDAIVAFAEEQVEPTNPMFLFTIADGSEGAYDTRTYQAYNEGQEEGKLYYSDGIPLYDGPEGNNTLGYNGLSATEESLGLNDASDIDANPDDLRGLSVHDANKPLEELYFAVYTDAAGVADSGVDLVDSDHKGCTLFKSSLDGTNSVAFTCEQLGLATTDQIDGLAVFKGANGPKIIFSVTSASQGATGSGVAAVLDEEFTVGATLFTSTGAGTNSVYLSGRSLGLDENRYANDDIDGLAIIDQPPVGGSNSDTCELTYDPYDAAEGGLLIVNGTAAVGNNVMVLFGPTDQAGSARLLAYNATTCQFLQQVDLPGEFADPPPTAIVPLTGWAANKPLDKVEYYQAIQDGYAVGLRRFDAAGEVDTTIAISNSYYTSPYGLYYEPGADELNVITTYNSGSVFTFKRPAADTTTLEPAYRILTDPCKSQANVGGVDSDGSLYLARSQEVDTHFRVCGFRPDGEMLPAPYSWSSEVGSYLGGFIVPGGAHFLLHSGEPMSIERSDFPKL